MARLTTLVELTVVPVDSPRCWMPDERPKHTSSYYAWIVGGLDLFYALVTHNVEVIKVSTAFEASLVREARLPEPIGSLASRDAGILRGHFRGVSVRTEPSLAAGLVVGCRTSRRRRRRAR